METTDRSPADAARSPDEVFFVGVGAPRSGTTWLAERMIQHPQVSMSPIKEMHWFDGDRARSRFERGFVERGQRVLAAIDAGEPISPSQAALLRRLALRTDEDYLAFLASWRDDRARAFGEFTPSYAVLPADEFGRIASLHPRTRFLFVMRNPVDRAWSHYRRLVKIGQMDAGGARSGDLPAGDLQHFLRLSEYETTLTNLWTAVDPSEVFACFYEDLISPDLGPGVLADLWAFLGVDDVPAGEDVFHRRTNRSDSEPLAQRERDRLVSMLSGVYRWAHSRFARLPASWVADLDALDV